MNRVKRNIPNAITCGNLLCGCLALVKAFEGDLVWAAYLVGIACVLDFFDGFAARMLGVSSPIGKDLDSLADMVTFGVVPGMVMYKLLLQSKFISDALELTNPPDTSALAYGPGALSYCYLGFLITVFSAIRLAKFNNDSRQTDSFIGVPTPANAIFICSLPLVLKQYSDKFGSEKNPFEMLVDVSSDPVVALLYSSWFLILLTIILSLLLVSEIPLFSLKFKSFGWKGNEIRFTFLLLAVLLMAFLKFVGIPLVIILYILMSAVNNFVSRSKKSVE
ncbi:MAG: CDP-alcohol phosphatidyltransferase family protein [Bacteroidia bacterium]